jgi:hypothetical protein
MTKSDIRAGIQKSNNATKKYIERGVGNEESAQRVNREQLGFMISEFLIAYDKFLDVKTDFEESDYLENPSSLNLFERIEDIEEKTVMNIKNKAHHLFRNEMKMGYDFGLMENLEGIHKEIYHRIKKSTETTLDSIVGSGFHEFMDLREAAYKLENYVPTYLEEHEKLQDLKKQIEKSDVKLSSREQHMFDSLVEINKDNISRIPHLKEEFVHSMDECYKLFQETAHVLKDYFSFQGKNEKLVLTLLLRKDLLTKLYGENGVEDIFSTMYEHIDIPGESGFEKALNYAMENCGNTTALSEKYNLD